MAALFTCLGNSQRAIRSLQATAKNNRLELHIWFDEPVHFLRLDALQIHRTIYSDSNVQRYPESLNSFKLTNLPTDDAATYVVYENFQTEVTIKLPQFCYSGGPAVTTETTMAGEITTADLCTDPEVGPSLYEFVLGSSSSGRIARARTIFHEGGMVSACSYFLSI